MAQRKKAGVSPKTIKWIWGVVFAPFALLAVMLLLTVPALLKGKLSRPQGIALLCIYAAFCVVQFTI